MEQHKASEHTVRMMTPKDEAAVRRVVQMLIPLGYSRETMHTAATICRFSVRAEAMISFLESQQKPPSVFELLNKATEIAMTIEPTIRK